MRREIKINSLDELVDLKYTDFKTLCKSSTVKRCQEIMDYLIMVRPDPKTQGQTSYFTKVNRRLIYVRKLLNGEII